MATKEAQNEAEPRKNEENAEENDYLTNSRTNLKQWRMFNAVVEFSSFSAAADHLNVSQATVSYTIAKLEEYLGVSVFKLDGRKYRLTEIGYDLAQRSKILLRDVVSLEKLARTRQTGAISEVKLAVSQSFPTQYIIPSLRQFSCHWRHAKVNLMEVAPPEVERVLYEHQADVAINATVPSGFTGNVLIALEYVAVASPDHPLHQKACELTYEDLVKEVRIQSKDEVPVFNASRTGNKGKEWYVSNFETADSAICEGIGYGWLPRNRIKKALENGKLKILPLQESASYKLNFYLIRSKSPGTSADALRLAHLLQSSLPDHTDLKHLESNP